MILRIIALSIKTAPGSAKKKKKKKKKKKEKRKEKKKKEKNGKNIEKMIAVVPVTSAEMAGLEF